MKTKKTFSNFTSVVKNLNLTYSLRAVLVLLLCAIGVGNTLAYTPKYDHYATLEVKCVPEGAGTVYTTNSSGSSRLNGGGAYSSNTTSSSAVNVTINACYEQTKDQSDHYKFVGWSESPEEPSSNWPPTGGAASTGYSVTQSSNARSAADGPSKTLYGYFAKKFYFNAEAKVKTGQEDMGKIYISYDDAAGASWATTSSASASEFGSRQKTTSVTKTLYLHAQAADNHEFLGWYQDGDKISGEENYQIEDESSNDYTNATAVTQGNIVAHFKASGTKNQPVILLSAGGVSYDGSENLEVGVGTIFSVGLDFTPDVTLSSSNISQISTVDPGEAAPVLVYDAGNLIVNRAGTATFTISQPETPTISEKTVVFTIVASKRVPQWEFTLPADLYERNGYDCPIRLIDARPEWTLTSTEPDIFTSLSQSEYGEDPTVLLGALTGAAQSFNLTFHQDGNYQYEEVHQVIPVTVKPQVTRLPIDGLNSTIADPLLYSTNNCEGSRADAIIENGTQYLIKVNSDDETCRLTIRFEGIPDELSCTLLGSSSDGMLHQTRWTIEESANGTTWTAVFPRQKPGGTRKEVGPLSLKPTTRYLRWTYEQGRNGKIADLKITELLFSSKPDFLIYHIGDLTPQQVQITCSSIKAVDYGFSEGSEDKFNITTANLYPVAFDESTKATADISISPNVTEPFDATWNVNLTKYGGEQKNVAVDLYVCQPLSELPLDVKTNVNDYYHFYKGSSKATYDKAKKKIEFDVGNSSGTPDRWVEFQFDGIPGDISFEPTGTIKEGAYWNIYEKASEGDSWKSVRRSCFVRGANTPISAPLSPTSHYVRIEFSGSTQVAAISNLKITKGAYIRSNHNLISFASDGAASKECSLTIANVNNLSVSMQNGTNYSASLSGNTLTINRTGTTASALYDMVVISGTSAVNGATITKYIPVNTVPSTITATNAANTGIKTGTRNNPTTEWAETSYTITDINVSGAFSDGKAFCDKMYIFDKSYNETNPFGSNIAVSLGNIAMTSCHVYTKSGDNYVYSKTIENVCAAEKSSDFNLQTTGTLKLYFTGFCPMLSVGYSGNDESAIYIYGSGSQSVDVYFDNCFVVPRRKTIEGYGTAEDIEAYKYDLSLAFFPKGSSAALCFKNTSTSGRLEANIHLKGRNMLYSGDGMFFYISGAKSTHQNAPLMVLMSSTSQKTTINIDDIWPNAAMSGSQRTNGQMMFNKGNDARPSIDLGNDNTILNFNGGQITLKNAYPQSSTYITTFAISTREYAMSGAVAYGLGNDQSKGTVNFNDGTFTGIAPSGFKNGNGQFDSYYKDADGNLDGTSLRVPKSSYINGGSFNCNVSTCTEVTSQGGSPTNSKGDQVCMLDLRASGGVDEKGFAIFDFPYGQISKSDGTTTLAQYYESKSTDYGHASITPKDEYVHLFLPCDYTERSAEMDYTVDIWKYALPSMAMSGSNASIAKDALKLPSTNLGGSTTINTTDNTTKNILWGRIDDYIQAASSDYRINDQLAGQAITDIQISINEGDYYSAVTNANEYVIKDGQYILLTVKADKYISLCSPFAIKNIYVVESYPEEKLVELAEGNKTNALYQQGYSNIDYCYQLAKAAYYTKEDFAKVNSSYRTWSYNQDLSNGYTGTQSAYNWRGVKKITPYVDFNLYENQEEWSIDENDNYTCDWATADGTDGVWMEKGRNYILQFPAKTANEHWDYWTGKMIIFEGLGEETIQGKNYHATIKTSASPSGEGKAVMLGNTTLADLTVQNDNLFYYDEESGMFLSEPDGDVTIQPAQGFLYATPKVDAEAPVELYGIEAYTGKCWYFLTYDEEDIMVERSSEPKTYKGVDTNYDGTENNRYIYRNGAWVEMTDEDNDHAWDASNDNTYIYYADAWVIVTKENGLYTDGDENKYTYDDATSAWKRLSIDCGIYSYENHTFMLINNALVPVTLNANDPAYRVDGSDPAQFYLDANGSCAWIAVYTNNEGAYYYGEYPYHYYIYLNDAWVAVDRVLNNPNWNYTYTDNSENYYIRNNDNWLIITGPDENHLYHGSDSKIYIYFGDPADWVEVTQHDGTVYTDGEKFYEYNTTSSKWEIVVVDIIVEAGEAYPVVGDQTLNDLTIKDNGSVTINTGNTLTVHNLIIEATPDHNQSGIVSGSNMAALTVEGDAFVDITMNSTGEMDATKYYSFAVPFAVNREDGVQRLNKNTGLWETAIFGANYLAYEYDEAERAANGPSNACWNKVTSAQYVPGKFYLCEFDNDNYNVYRFKASDKTMLHATSNYISVSKSNEDALNAGWNGVSGKGISYSVLSGAYGYMFALNSVANAFDIQLANSEALAVGHAVFVQVTEAGSITINQPSAAPARAQQAQNPIYCLRITAEGNQRYDDQLFFSASEEAQPVYVAGKDIEKMWMGTPSVARIWAVDYNGLRLAANDAVLADNQAEYQLGISAPKSGEYILALQESYEDATVYLTQNGTIIANLTLGEYPVSMEKGETAEYGLRIIVQKAPNVATDFDAAIVDNPNGVHKVIINDMMYIIKNKHVYTTNGQIVK